MGLTSKYGFASGWQPSADAVNCPEDGLLRMDNLVFDELGTHSLRLGSSKLNTALATTDVRSLYSVVIGTTKYRLAQGSGSVYGGTSSYSSIASGFDTSLDVQFSSYLGHVLMASGTVKKKWDGTTLRNWGIDAPPSAPAATFTNPQNKILASCDQGESTWTDNEYGSAATNITGYYGIANGARQITASSTTFRAVMSRDLGASTDFSDINGFQQTPDDMFTMWVRITDPDKVDSITIIIDFNGTSAATYDKNYATHTFDLADINKAIKDEQLAEQTTKAEEAIRDMYTVQGYSSLDAIARATSRVSSLNSDVRPELQGWHYFSCKRSEFSIVKTTEGYGWDTVRGVRISFQGKGQGILGFDALRFLSGRGTALQGTYVYRAVYVREDTSYVAMGVSSDMSDQIDMRGQSASLSVELPTDDQVTHIYIYRMGGFLDAFYRVATAAVITYDEANYTCSWETDYSSQFTAIAQFNFTSDWEDDYILDALSTSGPANRTTIWEDQESYYPGTFMVIDDQMNDADALILNIRLETDNQLPPDNIVGISEDYYTRIFALTSDGMLWPSRRLDPDAFGTLQGIRIGGSTDTPLWIKKTFGGLYVGTTKDIYRVTGEGNESTDGTIDFRVTPLNINSPPVDSSLASDGNIIIYRASDGPRHFSGETSTPLRGATDLLWRGYSRHGIDAINARGGRFRMAISNGVLKIITPEGDDTTSSPVVYAYNMAQQQWYRHVYNQNLRSIFREQDGTLTAGDDSGFVWELDDADASGDDGYGIPVELWTRCDDFGMPFKPKRTESFLTRIDTDGDAAALAIHFDGSSTATVTASPSSSGMGLSSKNLGLVKFRQFQWRISGDFTGFRFYGYTIQFVEAPESVEVYDSGPVDFKTNQIVYIRQLRLKAQTEVALTVTPYLNGEAQAAKTITPVCDEATVYTVDFGRELWAEQPRFVITAPTGELFEPYWMELTYRAAGTMSQKRTVRVAA